MNAAPETAEFLFTCEDCGKQFPADPDTMRTLRMMMFEPGKEFTDVERFDAIAELNALSATDLTEQGLDEEKRQALLRGEVVECGAVCICKPCQDKAQAESNCDCGCRERGEA